MDPDPPTKKYIPCQAGPHIYDASGVRSEPEECFDEAITMYLLTMPVIRLSSGLEHV